MLPNKYFLNSKTGSTLNWQRQNRNRSDW